MKKQMFGLFVLAAFVACATPASASVDGLQIWISDSAVLGGAWQQADAQASATIASYTGNSDVGGGGTGDFFVDLVATTSNSPGGPPQSELTLLGLSIHNLTNEARTLRVLFGDNDFTWPTSLADAILNSQINGTFDPAQGQVVLNVEYETFLRAGNHDANDTIVTPDIDSGLIQPAPGAGGFGAGNEVVGSFGSTPFSMAAIVTVEVAGGKVLNYTGQAASWAVPEPGSALIWSFLGLVAVAGTFSRRQKP